MQCRGILALSPLPATASAEGAQLNGHPFPATASAEGAQFNVLPFPATVWAEGPQLNAAPSLRERELKGSVPHSVLTQTW
jgi:hypothetical protein